jgi:hypothetical protein
LLIFIYCDILVQANQVSLDSDQVEIEYLVSVAYPHSVEPELGHKEAENVQNPTVVIPNMTEEVGEVEPNMMEEAVEGLNRVEVCLFKFV